MVGDEAGKGAFEVVGQGVVGSPQVGKLGVAADGRNAAGIEERGARRQVFEGTIGVPERVGLGDRAPTARFAPYFVLEIQVRNVGEFLADAESRVLVESRDTDLQRADMSCEIEMLLPGQFLFRKNQDRIIPKGSLDRGDLLGRKRQ